MRPLQEWDAAYLAEIASLPDTAEYERKGSAIFDPATRAPPDDFPAVVLACPIECMAALGCVLRSRLAAPIGSRVGSILPRIGWRRAVDATATEAS